MTAPIGAAAPFPDPPSRPVARMRRRGFWTDARFFVGVGLIIASVCGVWAVIAAARQSTPVYAAAHTIVRGAPIGPADLTVVDVALGRSAAAYLTSGRLPAHPVAARTIPAGELLAVTATQPAATVTTTTVVVRSAVDLPGAVRPGVAVELWAAAQRERGVYDVPRILVPDATVVAVTRDDGVMAGRSASVELVIPRADVAATLSAVAAESALSVVPAGGHG